MSFIVYYVIYKLIVFLKDNLTQAGRIVVHLDITDYRIPNIDVRLILNLSVKCEIAV